MPYNDKVFTITADNGKEFAGHETMSKELTSLLLMGARLE
jgi:IS30 family transposase